MAALGSVGPRLRTTTLIHNRCQFCKSKKMSLKNLDTNVSGPFHVMFKMITQTRFSHRIPGFHYPLLFYWITPWLYKIRVFFSYQRKLFEVAILTAIQTQTCARNKPSEDTSRRVGEYHVRLVFYKSWFCLNCFVAWLLHIIWHPLWSTPPQPDCTTHIQMNGWSGGSTSICSPEVSLCNRISGWRWRIDGSYT